MTSGKGSKPLREGSTQKRAAILAAARGLFLADGFDRSSVDAVAAQAGVSKRTVYDYFGDKRALLLAVVEQAAESLMGSIELAIDEDLADAKDLEPALVTFAVRIATATIGSSDYAALIRLVTMESANLPGLDNHRLAEAPEDALAAQLAEFGRQGLLHVPDPRLAADHFIGLTLLLAQNSVRPLTDPDHARVRQIIVEGVRAFLRAYSS